jgi:predicted DNA-binding protein (UPF0251 family)
MVRVADLERLISRHATCLGCGEAIEPGRRWHPYCATQQPDAQEKRRASWTADRRAATGARMAEWWSDEGRRRQQAERTRQFHMIRQRSFDAYKSAHDLLDADEMVEAIGPIRWRDRVSAERIRTLAREHEVGLLVKGFGGHASTRWLFTRAEVDQIRSLFKLETKDGQCLDCGRATYASVRCKACGDLQKGERIAALHEQLNAQIDALKTERDLRDLTEAAAEIDRAKSKVLAWARRLDVGLRVPNILGLHERWLFSEADVRTIREAIDHLAEQSAPDGMVAIRDSTKYPDWYLKRFKTTAKFGEYAPAIAAERGVKVGRPVELLDSERQEILRLDAEGRSQREIAAAVGVSRGKVQRLLNRPQAA